MSKKIVFDPKLLNPRNTSHRKKPTFKRSESSSITKLRKKILKQINTNTKPVPVQKQLPKMKKPDESANGAIKFLNNRLPANVPVVNPRKANAPIKSNESPIQSKISFEHVNLELPTELQEPPLRITGNVGKTRRNNEPMYGCLKRGKKPTYKKTTTRRNILFDTNNNNVHEFDNTLAPTMNINIDEHGSILSHNKSDSETQQTSKIVVSPNSPENISFDIEELSVPTNIEKQVDAKMDEINILDMIPENEILNDIEEKSAPNDLNKPHIKGTKQTKKMKLGKIGKKVSVLINDNTTRKNIRNEKHLLNITPIKKVKEYLKQNNLLEIGSIAPDDVLRSIYTNAKLSGELENRNGDVLLHNYITDQSTS